MTLGQQHFTESRGPGANGVIPTQSSQKSPRYLSTPFGSQTGKHLCHTRLEDPRFYSDTTTGITESTQSWIILYHKSTPSWHYLISLRARIYQSIYQADWLDEWTGPHTSEQQLKVAFSAIQNHDEACHVYRFEYFK